MKRVLTGLVACAFVLVFAPRTEALTLTFDTVYSGNSPSGAAPYLTAVFTNVDATHVSLTLTASLDGGEFVGDVFFNFNPALSLSSLTLTGTDADLQGSGTPSVFKGVDGTGADGDGLYDIVLGFPANGFSGSEVLTYTFVYTGAGTFNADSFNFFSTPKSNSPNETGPFSAAAHIQGLANGCSGWVAPHAADPNDNGTNGGTCVATTTTGVQTTTTGVETTTTGVSPEPTMLALLGSGLVMAGRRLRRRKTETTI